MDYQPEKQDGAYIICKKDIRTSVGDMTITNQEGVEVIVKKIRG